MPQRSRNIFNEQVVDRVELFPSQGCLTTKILGMTTVLTSSFLNNHLRQDVLRLPLIEDLTPGTAREQAVQRLFGDGRMVVFGSLSDMPCFCALSLG